jgi:hypothetical protein
MWATDAGRGLEGQGGTCRGFAVREQERRVGIPNVSLGPKGRLTLFGFPQMGIVVRNAAVFSPAAIGNPAAYRQPQLQGNV